MTGPGYTILIVLHVLSAVVGFGALGATGAYAAALRRGGGTEPSPPVKRYFRSGRNLPSLAVVLVPVFGAALLAAGHGADVGDAFPWVGLGLWIIAGGVASAVIWPTERAIQALLAKKESASPTERLASLARRCEVGAALTSFCFLGAVFVMIVQPG